MDAFTEKHFSRWLDSTVHWTEREKVAQAIQDLLITHPTLIEEGKSWPEMRRMTEEEKS